MNTAFNLIIAGGKTGGHLFPGIAVAQAIQRIHPGARILFVGTKARFEIKTLERYGYAHTSIVSRPVKGGNLVHKAVSAGLVLVSLIQSLILIKKQKPDFVLGVGGFSSFSIVLAAWILGLPTAIHEQNAFPGLTNRLLSKFARTIFTSFKKTRGFDRSPRVRYVGNPVRKSIHTKSDHLDLDGFDPEKFTLLVTGGSQGASSINTAFIDALCLMKNVDQLNIIHQTGVNDQALIQQRYADLNITATARAFFHTMPQIQDMADLAITRAGAGILSELCIKGLPAILIPFPHAADDHQTFNAQALAARGAALWIKDENLTGQGLKNAIKGLIQNPEKLARMRASLKQMAMADADEKIANHILQAHRTKA